MSTAAAPSTRGYPLVVRWPSLLCLTIALGCGATAPPDGPADAGPPPAPFALGFATQVSDVATDARGNVYALTADGQLHGLSPDGSTRFAPIDLGDVPREGRHGLVGLDDGAAVMGPGDARRYDASGALRWVTPVAGPCAIARGTDGTVAVAGASEIAILDAVTGERVRGLDVASTCAAALDAAVVIAGAPDGAYVVAPPLRRFPREGAAVGERAVQVLSAQALAVAPDGTVAIAGTYDRAGTARDDFPDLPAPTQFDPVVLLYDADLTPRAAVPFMGPDFEHAYGLDADADGFLVAGHFGEFGNGLRVGPFELVDSDATREVFLARLGLDGTVRHAASVPGAGAVARQIVRHPTGRWVVGGLLFPGPLLPAGLPPVEGGGFVMLAGD